MRVRGRERRQESPKPKGGLRVRASVVPILSIHVTTLISSKVDGMSRLTQVNLGSSHDSSQIFRLI